jgi:hypothetical protein
MITEQNMEYKIIFLDEKLIHKDLSKIPQENRDIIFEKLKTLSKS